MDREGVQQLVFMLVCFNHTLYHPLALISFCSNRQRLSFEEGQVFHVGSVFFQRLKSSQARRSVLTASIRSVPARPARRTAAAVVAAAAPVVAAAHQVAAVPTQVQVSAPFAALNWLTKKFLQDGENLRK